ncbi:MAG TPA: hypothetical protein PLQ00_07105 [Thermoguttaceae bacterium]|nr:hypothetical protein [Thermoguttaceae bacterium]
MRWLGEWLSEVGLPLEPEKNSAPHGTPSAPGKPEHQATTYPLLFYRLALL